MWRSAPVIVLGALFFSLEPAALAQTTAPPVDLRWHAPKECPDAEMVLARTHELAGNIVSATRVEADANITKHDGRYELVMVVRADGMEQTRTATSAACATLRDAAAVILAVALDQAREPAEAEPPKPASPAVEPNAAPRVAAPPTPAKPRAVVAPRSGTDLLLGATMAFDAGTLPRVTAGLGVDAGVALGAFRFGAAGVLYEDREVVYAEKTASGAVFGLARVGAYGCWLAPVAWSRVGTCVKLGIGYLQAEGTRIRAPEIVRVTWPEVALGIAGELPIAGPVSLALALDMVVPFDAPLLVLSSGAAEKALHEPSTPSLTAGLGFRIRIQ